MYKRQLFHKETSVKAKKSKTKSSAKKTKTAKKVQLNTFSAETLKNTADTSGKKSSLNSDTAVALQDDTLKMCIRDRKYFSQMIPGRNSQGHREQKSSFRQILHGQ